MNNLAYFLIDKNRNVNEGLELADTLLKLNPNNFHYLHHKGYYIKRHLPFHTIFVRFWFTMYNL